MITFWGWKKLYFFIAFHITPEKQSYLNSFDCSAKFFVITKMNGLVVIHVFGN